ncbi:MAG: HAD family hydrolase [Ruminococcaceae bacterium]|nr:HAD family hydrolase [Oscillospiraceae bacterium]
MEIKSAIFDMDGTLVDSLMVWDVLWQKFGDKYLGGRPFAPTPEDDKAIRTLPLKNAMELVHTNYNIGKSGQELLDETNEMMVDFYSNTVQLKSGVKEFLENLYNKGVKMCIASATAPNLVKIAMDHCELNKYFPKVFSCGDLGLGKDKPDIYLLAQQYLGTEISETWVFEDSFVAIKTAHDIGMNTVGIYDKFNPYQEEIKKIANHYIADGETLLKL